jgi:hypothetical protein
VNDYIDMTPTWTTAMRIYINVLENESSEEAKALAREDLMRLAASVDEQKKQSKEQQSTLGQSVWDDDEHDEDGWINNYDEIPEESRDEIDERESKVFDRYCR